MSKSEKNQSFADKLTELELIVSWLDEDHSDIDESLKKFERGMELAKELKEHMAETEIKVKKIQASFNID